MVDPRVPLENQRLERHTGLPDTQNLHGLCPRCGYQAAFTVRFKMFVTSMKGLNGTHHTLDQVVVLECSHCKQGTVVLEEDWTEGVPTRSYRPTSKDRDFVPTGFYGMRGFSWWPLPDQTISDDIPEVIASAFLEGTAALYARCPRAAAAMLRRSVESMTTDKGATKGTLAARLKALAANGVLSPPLAEWAEEIKEIGNAAAHDDILVPVEMEDVQALHGYCRELLRHLYEIPADIARRRSGRPTRAGNGHD